MAGWKQWAIGEIVEAGDIQGFIQNQTVMVFDTDTARDTALSGVVIEGMMAYTKDSDSVKVYDGAAWIGLAEAPDLSTLIPKSTVTTAGDLIVADGASSVTRIGVGTDDQVLTLVSGAPAWADAGGGGGGLTSIASGSFPSSSSISITGIPNTYKGLIFEWRGVQSTTADTSLSCRFNTTADASYSWCYIKSTASGVDVAASDDKIQIAEGIGNVYSWKGSAGFIQVMGIGSPTPRGLPVSFNSASENNAGDKAAITGSGVYQMWAAITSAQLVLGAGTFTTGDYVLWGVS
jgi:hypothetical protein